MKEGYQQTWVVIHNFIFFLTIIQLLHLFQSFFLLVIEIWLISLLLNSPCCEAVRGVSRHHSGSSSSSLPSRGSSRSSSCSSSVALDTISNYAVYSEKLVRPCSSRRTLVKRSHRSDSLKNIKTFLSIVKDSAPRKNSMNLLSNLVDFVARLSNENNGSKEEGRMRREITISEFNLRRREILNIVSGIQNIISDHVVQVILLSLSFLVILLKILQ